MLVPLCSLEKFLLILWDSATRGSAGKPSQTTPQLAQKPYAPGPWAPHIPALNIPDGHCLVTGLLPTPVYMTPTGSPWGAALVRAVLPMLTIPGAQSGSQ